MVLHVEKSGEEGKESSKERLVNKDPKLDHSRIYYVGNVRFEHVCLLLDKHLDVSQLKLSVDNKSDIYQIK